MKTNNLSGFSVDKENSTVNVKRKFKAPRSRVWTAWTEQEILDQWWAPKPWKSVTKSMDFKEGGQRIYAMVGPEGEEHWGVADFKAITPGKNFKFYDGFCDENGNINNGLPRSLWSVDFTDQEDSTAVTIQIEHESPSDLEKIIEMGFREGFTAALDNLDDVLLKK